MAKELPYFKFEPNEWSNGNIQMCSDSAKIGFINICCSYWSRLGDISDNFAKIKCCEKNEAAFNELIEENIIKSINGKISIGFLDNQLSDFKDVKKSRAESGRKGGQKGGVRPQNERIKGKQIYLIRCFGNGEEFLKFGTTKDCVSRRFSGKMPYEYELVWQLVTDDYIEIECEYCELFSKCEYKPRLSFQGQKECFNIESYQDIKGFLEKRHSVAVASLKRSQSIREEKIREEETREDNIKEVKNKPFAFRSALIDFGFEKELVDDWLTVRKNKKSSNTLTAFNKFTNQITESGLDKNYILRTCVENSWSGFEKSWIKNPISGKPKMTQAELIKHLSR
jgi:hypothetical protein